MIKHTNSFIELDLTKGSTLPRSGLQNDENIFQNIGHCTPNKWLHDKLISGKKNTLSYSEHYVLVILELFFLSPCE